MTSHPLTDLSAYADGALDPATQTAVQAHLDGCPVCRTRLGELRSVSRLMAGLPVLAPRRSLVPRFAPARPAWLAPARTLSTLASGIFVFAFLVSGVLFIDPNMGGGGKGGLLVPRDSLTASRQSTAPNSAFGAAPAAPAVAPAAAPAPAIAPSVANPGAPAQRNLQESQAADAAKATAAGAASDTATTVTAVEPGRLALGPSPLVWLALAIGFGGIAFVLRRRMRSV